MPLVTLTVSLIRTTAEGVQMQVEALGAGKIWTRKQYAAGQFHAAGQCNLGKVGGGVSMYVSGEGTNHIDHTESKGKCQTET